MKAILKCSVRRALDYLAKRIADDLHSRRMPACSMPPPPLLLTDFNHYLHELRSFLLSSMPAGAQTVCSVGCSGAWYFDWVTREYGPVARHIGVEYFTPKPDDLPANVEWLAQTAGDMSAVPDASVDMLISGQNLEHLPLADIIGFFRHAWRILRPGGWLIMDSPNGAITSLIGWQQPEHVAEYTPDDMRQLLPAAGFDVIQEKGLICLRDKNGTTSKLPDMNWDAGSGNALRRAMEGLAAPDDSFVWWFEARKAQDNPPDVEAFAALARDIFARAHRERCNRVSLLGGRPDMNRPDMVIMDKGKSGPVWQGPYIPLFKGHRKIEARIFAEDLPKENVKIIDCNIIDNTGENLWTKSFSTADFKNNRLFLSADFHIKETSFGIEILLTSSGAALLNIPLTISVS